MHASNGILLRRHVHQPVDPLCAMISVTHTGTPLGLTQVIVGANSRGRASGEMHCGILGMHNLVRTFKLAFMHN
jgi:hypothetical protein